MTRILVVDNTIDRECWGAREFVEIATRRPEATVVVRRAPERDLPSTAAGFDRVLLTGSRTSVTERAPWITELKRFVAATVERGIPILGVCYGHQILAAACFGDSAVGRARQPERGWTRIARRVDDSGASAPGFIAISPPILNGRRRSGASAPKSGSPAFLQGLPESFHSFSWHEDEVVSIPDGIRVLADSERCRVQAFQIGDRPAYGVQFHPERTLEGGERAIAEARKKGSVAGLLSSGPGITLFDPQVGERIIGGFLGPS